MPVTLIYLCAKTNTPVPADFMRAWTASAIDKMRDFNPQVLSNSIYALAKLRYHPSADFMRVWTASAIEKISDFNPQALSNSVLAVGKLNIKVDKAYIVSWVNSARTKKFNQLDIKMSIDGFRFLNCMNSPPVQMWLASIRQK